MPFDAFKCDLDEAGCGGGERPQREYLARFCRAHYKAVVEGQLEYAQCVLGDWGAGATPLQDHHWQCLRRARRTD